MKSEWLESRAKVVLAFIALFAVCIALGMLGVSSVALAWPASVIGVALVIGHIQARRHSAANTQHPEGLPGMTMKMPATRLGYGTKWWHFKFLSPTKEVLAGGMLWVGPSRMAFTPSSPSKADRAWSADVQRVEVIKVFGRECMLRIHDTQTPAQFSLMMPPEQALQSISGVINAEMVTERR